MRARHWRHAIATSTRLLHRRAPRRHGRLRRDWRMETSPTRRGDEGTLFDAAAGTVILYAFRARRWASAGRREMESSNATQLLSTMSTFCRLSFYCTATIASSITSARPMGAFVSAAFLSRRFHARWATQQYHARSPARPLLAQRAKRVMEYFPTPAVRR